MSIPLTQGAVSRIYNNITNDKPYVQLLEIKRIGSQAGNNAVERFRLIVSDGTHYQQAMLATQLNTLVNENKIRDSCVVQLEEYLCNVISNRKIIIILNLSVVSDGNGSTIGSPQNIDVAGGPGAMASKPVAGAPVQTRPTPTPYQSSRGPTTSMTDIPQHYNPISTLNPYQHKWTIKARVTNKSDMRTWQNERGGGKLFSVDLLDGSGGQIKATMFNDAADKWFPMFQQDQVYVISKGSLKLANKKFNRVPNEYELTLNHDAEVQLFGEDDSIEQQKFHFTTIDRIGQIEMNTNTNTNDYSDAVHVDVMGIVVQVHQPREIDAKNKTKRINRRSIMIVDESSYQVELTLWGEQADKYNEAVLNHAIVMKSCRVGEYNGSRNLSATFNSQIYIDPPYPEVGKLRDWWNATGSQNTQWTSISGSRGGGRGAGHVDERIVFAEMPEKGKGDKADYFSVRGTVTFFRHADDRPPWYMACSNPECKGRKMTSDASGQGLSCTNPNCRNTEATPRYILSLLVCDATGAQWLTAFNDTAQKLLGISAAELESLKPTNPAAYEDIFTQANFKSYIFKCRAKQDTSNDDTRTRCHIMEVEPLNFEAETQQLMEKIKLYQQ